MKQRNRTKLKRKDIFDEKGLLSFALQLKKIRKEKGMTQAQLAFESGIALSQIARIETARINTSLSTIFTIAKALEINLSEFFDFKY